jgi:uncharacterized protein (TIGR02597 family)
MQRANYARGLRFLPKVAVVTTVGLISAAICYQAAAQVNVYTDPVGFITLTSTGNGFSYLGIGMTQIPAARGLVTSVSGNAVGISGLTAGQYNTVLAGGVQVPAFYLEDTTSNYVYQGLSDDILSNDANNVYLSSSVAGLINVGDNFKIMPHQTLNTVFGTSNQNQVVYGSNTLAEADNIIVWNPVTQSTATYYYRSQGSIGWRSATAGSTVDAGNTPLYVDQSVELQRKQVTGTNVNFQVVGAVKLGPTITSVPGGSPANSYVYIGNMMATSVELTNLNLYTGIPTTGVFGSNTLAESDNVIIWNPLTQSTATYYYRAQGSIGWRTATQGSTVDAGTNVLPIGTVFEIQHKVASPFNWTIPAQY